MSIESLPKTLSGSARVRNLTHYNTDDLIKLIDSVERSRCMTVVRWCNTVESSMAGGLEKVFEFRVFTGKPRDRRPHGTTVAVRQFVMHRRWRSPLVFRLLPPEKLYVSPVQSLVVSGEDSGEMLPSQMTYELADALAGVYDVPYTQRHNLPKIESVVGGLRVRIESKRKPRSRKQAILARKRELLHQHFRRAGYRIGQVERALVTLTEAFTAMHGYAKGMGMDTTSIAGMVETVVATRTLFGPLRGEAEKYAVEAQQLVDEAE